MIARARLAVPALLVAGLLAGCGEPTDAATLTDEAARDRAWAVGTTRDYVYVTEIPGFEVATQSVGIYGDTGFQSVYVRSDGTQIHLSVDRVELTAASCPSIDMHKGYPESDNCRRDDELWYRVRSPEHEYTAIRDTLVVRLSADAARVDRATLRAAAQAAHPADNIELDAVLPRRGDLPTTGDGAPIDPPRAGG